MRELNTLGRRLGLDLRPFEGRQISLRYLALVGLDLGKFPVQNLAGSHNLSAHVGPDVGRETTDCGEMIKLEHEVFSGVSLSQLNV